MSQDTEIQAYQRTRAQLVELMQTPGEADRPVAACPGWRARDVLAHVTGIAVDVLDGRLPSGDVSKWTAEQVALRADRSVEEVIREWEGRAPGFEEAMHGPLAGAAHRFAADVVSHYYDVASAFGATVDRDTDEVTVALGAFASMLGQRVDDARLPAIRIEAAASTWTAGVGPPGATLRADPFEALRALSGRRTFSEVVGLEWDGDPDPYAAVISAFPFPERSLGE